MSDTECDEDDYFDVNYDYANPRILPINKQHRWYSIEDEWLEEEKHHPIDNAAFPSTSVKQRRNEDSPLNFSGEISTAQHDDFASEDNDEEIIENVFVHIYDQEGRYYTDLTTFHGMRRIFVAESWNSRLFWCVVVTSCLTMYMIFSGRTLMAYHNRMTFFINKAQQMEELFDHLQSVFCPEFGNHSLSCRLISFNSKQFQCEQTEQCVLLHYLNEGNVNGLRFVKRLIDLNFENTGIDPDDVSFKVLLDYSVKYKGYLSGTVNGLHVSLRKRILLPNHRDGACASQWPEVLHNIPISVKFAGKYTMKRCETILVALWTLSRFNCVPANAAPLFETSFQICANQTMSLTDLQLTHEIVCPVTCEEVYLNTRPSAARPTRKLQRKARSLLLTFDTWVSQDVQTRKMGLVEVLSLIGGATSLFLGCSCVTVMEMFMFLFKSAAHLLSKSTQTENRQMFELNIPERKYSGEDVIENSPRRLSWLDQAGSSHSSEHGLLGRIRPPSLKQIKDNVNFNKGSSHSIEKFVRKLPVQDRLSVDINDETKYLCRQGAIDIPEEELKEYFAQNGLEFSEEREKPIRNIQQKKSVAASDSSSKRSSLSARSRRSFNPEVNIIRYSNEGHLSTRRPSAAYTRKMPMNDF